MRQFQWPWLGIMWLCVAGPWIALPGQEPASSQSTWYRGNLHTHSFWSDGNDFPEMIVDWYRQQGYQFLALTDHNTLGTGNRWISRAQVDQRSGQRAWDKCVQRFGAEWIETRTGADAKTGELITEIRLKTLDDYREKFEAPGEFLLLSGEEISDSVKGRPVHMNATNLVEVLSPMSGQTVREAIAANLRLARAQEARTGKPILVHVNHPNYGFAVTAEDLAFVVEEQFFEVYNGHPAVGHTGQDGFPAVETLWDIANTLRIADLKSPPLFGLGTDDSHNYHDQLDSISGRGWVMVRAPELSPEALIKAMREGDFYASSGVTLEEVQYDQETRRLSLKIQGEPGITYETRFIGTLKSADRSSTPAVDEQGAPRDATRRYSPEIGRVLKTETGTTPSFQLTGDEWYVRAVVTSSKPHPKPSFDQQREQAWTQPVGWEIHLK